MLDVALKVLEKIEEHGFKAYIVGGFVRDYILGNTTNDVDICTEATPKDIKEIFENITLPKMDYGAVRLDIKKHRFDIMTFRNYHYRLFEKLNSKVYHPGEFRTVNLTKKEPILKRKSTKAKSKAYIKVIKLNSNQKKK